MVRTTGPIIAGALVEHPDPRPWSKTMVPDAASESWDGPPWAEVMVLSLAGFPIITTRVGHNCFLYVQNTLPLHIHITYTCSMLLSELSDHSVMRLKLPTRDYTVLAWILLSLGKVMIRYCLEVPYEYQG